MAGITPEGYRRKMTRAYELPLLYMVMLFQFACMLLLAFRDGPVETFSLSMSVCLPFGTYLGFKVLTRLFYADRCVYILVSFLWSLGVILLRAVLKKETDASEQAFFIGIGFVFMLIVMIAGHVLNLAINLLGTFVHAARLQYIEFFGKFYEDGGELFSPALPAENYSEDCKDVPN